MEKMIVRQPALKSENLHPEAKKRYNRMMQEPQPLSFKLHDWPVPEVQAKLDAIKAIQEQKAQAGEYAAAPDKAIQNVFIPINKPLGTLEELPFEV